MRTSPFLLIPVLVAFVLAGCAPSPETDDRVQVVASTNVYGDLVSAIGGDLVAVTSIIDNPDQDPHEFEADARTELALSKADLVVRNGGGYDDFVDTLLGAADNPDVVVIDAVDLSGFDTEAPDFNEHVWYDYPTVMKVVQAIDGRLEALDPANASVYASNASALLKSITGLQDRVAEVKAAHVGVPVAITEPVPLYLLDAMGLVNRTPAEFSEAVENDTDVPATVLRDTLQLFADHEVDLLVYNPQTGGPQTDAVLAAAEDAGIAAVEAGELLPEGTSYVAWQAGVIAAIAAGLSVDVAVEPILTLRDAELTLGGRVLWSGLDLDVAPGEFVAVLGSNGSGKTSLLNAILGQHPLTAGEGRFLGEPLHRGDRRIGYVPQHRLADDTLLLRGRDLVGLGLDGHRWGPGLPTRARRERVDALLDAVGAGHYSRVPVTRLSGGEQQRLRIGQALAGDPRLLLCDEPLSSLDLHAQRVVTDLIDRHRRERGFGVLFVTHDVNPILDRVDRVLYLAGHRFRVGTPDEVLRSDVLSELYGSPVDVIRAAGRVVIVGAPDEHHLHDHHERAAS